MLSAPVRLSGTVTINRPAPVLWDVIADYGADVRRRAGLLKMTPDPSGPPRDGTRVREVLRTAGRTYVTNTVVSDVVEGTSYRFEGSGTSGDVRGRRLVEPTHDATVSEFIYEIELVLRGASRSMKPLVAKIMTASLRKDLQLLKEQLEAGAGS